MDEQREQETSKPPETNKPPATQPPPRVIVAPTPAQRLKFKAIDTLHWLIVRRGRRK